MSENDRVDVDEKVRKIMVDVLDLNVTPVQLLDDTSLYSPLIQMDSLKLLQLLVVLEEEFGGHIDDEDVMNADLEDVSSLIGLVRSKIAA